MTELGYSQKGSAFPVLIKKTSDALFPADLCRLHRKATQGMYKAFALWFGFPRKTNQSFNKGSFGRF